MNDALYEQLVTRKQQPREIAIRILSILLVAAVAVLGFPFLGLFSFFVAILLALAVYHLVFPRLNVEYEYTLLNHDMQIDIIYNREKRKPKLNIDIQSAEIIAPLGSPKLSSYKPDQTYDFSDGSKDRVYAIMMPLNQKNVCILFSPDSTMLAHMKQWTGRRLEEASHS